MTDNFEVPHENGCYKFFNLSLPFSLKVTTGYASASRLTGITYLELPHGDCFLNVETYKLSTLSLAHCVLRKNFRDDLIDGSLLKQLMLIL